jgi:hypothetical protein
MFWFDFFGGYALDEYSVRAIGNRRIVKNDDDATAIYYK